MLLYFCTQKNERQTHTCHYQPPFSQQTIYLFEQIENEVFRCFQLVYLFFSFIFHLDCEGVSDGGTHAHPLTRISDREKEREKTEIKKERKMQQPSANTPEYTQQRVSFFSLLFFPSSAFCFITAYRTGGEGPTPHPLPLFSPTKTLAALEAVKYKKERKGEREAAKWEGGDNP